MRSFTTLFCFLILLSNFSFCQTITWEEISYNTEQSIPICVDHRGYLYTPEKYSVDNGSTWIDHNEKYFTEIFKNGNKIYGYSNNSFYELEEDNNGYPLSISESHVLSCFEILYKKIINETLYLCTTRNFAQELVVFYSDLDNISWSEISVEIPERIQDMCMIEDKIVYVTTWGEGLFKYYLEADILNKVESLTPQHLYTVRETKMGNLLVGSLGDIHLSSDMGDNWSNKGINSKIVEFDFHPSINVIIAGSYGCTGSGEGAFMSIDNGNSWTKVNNGLTKLSPTKLAISNDYVFASIGYGYPADGGIFRASFENFVDWISFYNVLPYHNDINSPYVFWSARADSPSYSPIKICSDGSTSTMVEYTNNSNFSNSKIKFRTKTYYESGDSELGGIFDEEGYSISGNKITAILTHPTYMNNDGQYRNETIQIVNTGNYPQVLHEFQVKVYRAPVVMVHGLWGDRTTFMTMEDDLINTGKYNGKLLHRADYEPSNSLSFNENANVIKNAINSTLLSLRSDYYSAGSVDIIAHSMGGVLSRHYLQRQNCDQSQDNICFRNDIHKLITIGSPHSGTQAANLLLSETNEGELSRFIVNKWLKRHQPGKKVIDGAVNDLRVDSEPILDDLNGINLNNNIAPSHVITSEGSFNLAVDWTLFLKIASDLLNISVENFLDELYNNEPYDLIVPLNSQDGGLSSMNTTHFYDQIHLGQAANPFIIYEVEYGLDKYYEHNYFADNGFSPVILSSDYKVSQVDEPLFLVANSEIEILNPTEGSEFNAGDTIKISIQGSNEIEKILLLAFANSTSESIFRKDTSQVTNPIITYPIPEDSYGETEFIVFGVNNQGEIVYDSLTINVGTTAILDSLKCDPDKLIIASGEKEAISIIGYFNDGIQRDLNHTPSVQYEFTDNTIAKHNYLNSIKGLEEGETVLTIKYQDKNSEMPVIVYQAGNWITSIWEGDFGSDDRYINTLNSYPNPFNSTLKVKYTLNNQSDVYFYLYDYTGKECFYRHFGQESRGDHSKSIDLSQVKPGLYIAKLKTSSGIMTAKVVKID